MPARPDEGVDDQYGKGYAGEHCRKTKEAQGDVPQERAWFFDLKFFGDALFLVAFPLVAALVYHFFFGDLSVENHEVHREFFDTHVGVEEVNGKDKAYGQKCLIGVDDGGYVENPSG